MISILLATADRPEMARACIESIVATTAGYPVELVIAIDGPETQEYPYRIWDNLPMIHSILVDHRTEYRGGPQAWNDALALSTGDPVVLAADDLEFQPGWLEAALAKMAEHEDGWGFVGFNDGVWGEDLSTHYMMSRRFIVECLGGVIAWPCYAHSFIDREANERARRAGRYAWAEDARVVHRHWTFGSRQQDATDTRRLGEHPESQRIFALRASEGFPDNYPPVIAA